MLNSDEGIGLPRRVVLWQSEAHVPCDRGAQRALDERRRLALDVGGPPLLIQMPFRSLPVEGRLQLWSDRPRDVRASDGEDATVRGSHERLMTNRVSSGHQRIAAGQLAEPEREPPDERLGRLCPGPRPARQFPAGEGELPVISELRQQFDVHLESHPLARRDAPRRTHARIDGHELLQTVPPRVELVDEPVH